MREFLAFMSGFRSEAERTKPSIFAQLFPSKLHRFREESEKIKADLSAEIRIFFEQAVTALCRLTDSQVEEVDTGEYRGRARVTKAIDDVVNSLG